MSMTLRSFINSLPASGIDNIFKSPTLSPTAVFLKDKIDEQTGLAFDPDFCGKGCSANCYLYAINNSSFRLSQTWPPSDYNDSPLATKEGLRLRIVTAAERDGLVYVGKNRPDMRGREGYLIAFYLDYSGPGRYWDYHFLRQDSRSAESWSGKNGLSGKISNLDERGRKIKNPETAAMGNYKFVGYFIAPKGGLNPSR